MSGKLVIRLRTGAGQSRFELPDTATYQDLQEKVQEKSGVAPSAQKIALDPAGKQVLNGAPGALLTSMGVRRGDMLHLLDSKDATIKTMEASSNPLGDRRQELDAPKVDMSKITGGMGTISGKVPANLTKENLNSVAGSSSSSSSSHLAPPSGANKPPLPSDASSVANKGSVLSKADPNSSSGEKKEPKHYAFEEFIKMRRFDTSSLPMENSFKPTYMKKGEMNKLPPSVNLVHQKYRHCDHLEYMNVDEMQGFVRYWQQKDMIEQRGGFMYGYYRDDSHYTGGCRAVLEAVYEPAQAGVVSDSGMVMFTKLNDKEPERELVEKICDRLGLMMIGWIFTGMPQEEVLNAPQAVEVTQLQLKYMATDKTPHYSGYDISKFLTCTVRPNYDNGGNPDTSVMMTSDQGMAMIRDGLIDIEKNKDPKHLKIREATKGELMPTILQSGKDMEEGKFDPDWFIVKVNDGVPKKRKSIFKYSLFPVENRMGKPTRTNLKQYFDKIPKSEPSWARFADFHLLLYLAKEFDLDTVLLICDAIRDRTEVPDGIQLMFREI